MGSRTLLSVDTDHIKQFVFATNKLKEIRGASSLLDKLNRREMNRLAKKHHAESIYTNGGSGMFLVQGDKKQAEAFARDVQQVYLKETAGGAAISFGMEEIPDSIQADSLEALKKNKELHPYMRLLQYRLLQNKGLSLQEIAVLPSHPFMRLCDACGVRYAEDKYRGESTDLDGTEDTDESLDPDDQERRYCGVCLKKRAEDNSVRKNIRAIIKEQKRLAREQGSRKPEIPEQESESKERSYIWETIIKLLLKESYNLPDNTNRPTDFNKLEGLSGGRDYMALIYADANQMGTVMDDLPTLEEREAMAKMVDNAIYTAMSRAAVQHLPVVPRERKGEHMFPFDILMIGGDDVMVVTPANVAMDVALTLAKEFRDETKKQGCTLSVAVVLAPVKYPFGLLHELAETTLKYAKKEGAKREEAAKRGKLEGFDKTTINFVVVAGNTGHEFDKIMESLSRKKKDEQARFYATLRPYSVKELEELRAAILKGKEINLGHTKLHQLREAVMKKNLTSSVSDARAILNNWKGRQWQHIYSYIYAVANRYQEPYKQIEKPESLFPHIRFPWFEDGEGVYRSSLLDFAELYDFIEQKGGNGGAKN